MQTLSLKNISGLSTDSRKVKNGEAFFAIKGNAVDGHDFIEQAIKNGAALIVGEKDLELSIPYIKSTNIRHDLAIAAAEFFGKQPQRIAAVTGTNGKTSVADFSRQLWEFEKLDCASIGTLGVIHNGENITSENTSPDPISLHKTLSQIKDAAVIEASSIGLEQHRLDGVKINAAAFTNFTRDHLDYHENMEEYFRCKTLLFDILADDGVAVLNSELQEFKVKQKKITFGKNADLELINSTPLPDGQILELKIFGEIQKTKIELVGKFQAENILCTIGLTGISKNLGKLKPVAGRMQQAASGVYIDYAHTPDALENALKSLHPHMKGNLILVFGCGGDRDKGKRSLMGEIAAKFADIIIVTDDNPRTENADEIRKEILAKCPQALEIGDRKDAIEKAIELQKSDDIVLIAGKGHEKYQIIGNEKHYFDDFKMVKDIT